MWKENKSGFILFGCEFFKDPVPKFTPSATWRGPDLQTIRNIIMGVGRPLVCEGELQFFKISQNQKIAGWFHKAKHPAGKNPLVLILHGLAGSSQSASCLSAAAYFISKGFSVLRMNLRGTGPSSETSHSLTHAGITKDVAAICQQIPQENKDSGIFLYGISLGGNLAVKAAAELGKDCYIKAVSAISNPLSLAGTERRMRDGRNLLYMKYLLSDLKKLVTLSKDKHPEKLYSASQAAKNIYEFDDGFLAELHGFSGADEYYHTQSSEHFLHDTKVPTLMIQSEDDPWIPSETYMKQVWNRQGNVTLLFTQKGGHVGFHEAGSSLPWHEKISHLYFEQVLAGE
jgi:predicted alpha/beta-fold hydrolase